MIWLKPHETLNASTCIHGTVTEVHVHTYKQHICICNAWNCITRDRFERKMGNSENCFNTLFSPELKFFKKKRGSHGETIEHFTLFSWFCPWSVTARRPSPLLDNCYSHLFQLLLNGCNKMQPLLLRGVERAVKNREEGPGFLFFSARKSGGCFPFPSFILPDYYLLCKLRVKVKHDHVAYDDGDWWWWWWWW